MDFQKAFDWMGFLPPGTSIKRGGKEIQDMISRLSADDKNFTTDDEDGDGNWNIRFDENAARETLIRFVCWLLNETTATDRKRRENRESNT